MNILIATPGRLLDFVDRNYVSFRNIKYLVLDEADRMLDMGFMPDVTKMVRNPDMPDKGDRQTLMFSATFPERIQQLAAEFLNNYLFLAVGVVGGACADVKQDFFEVESPLKLYFCNWMYQLCNLKSFLSLGFFLPLENCLAKVFFYSIFST